MKNALDTIQAEIKRLEKLPQTADVQERIKILRKQVVRLRGNDK